MSGELDQISMQIGRILSTQEEANRVREALFRKIDSLADNMTEVKGVIKAVSDGHSELKAKIDGKVMPAIEDMKLGKAKMTGFAAAVGLLAGAAGTKIAGAFTKVVGP